MKQKEKETLNKLQVEAVTSPFTSPLLVVAGPGTGKTKVIVERIKHMVKNGIKPSEILCLTFSEKATLEMLERLEKEFDVSESVNVESLKISVRDLNKDDISERGFPKNTTGVVITQILEGSPLMFVSVNDVIVELQKKKVRNSNHFNKLVSEITNKDKVTLYLAIYNSSNQRSYITVKLK